MLFHHMVARQSPCMGFVSVRSGQMRVYIQWPLGWVDALLPSTSCTPESVANLSSLLRFQLGSYVHFQQQLAGPNSTLNSSISCVHTQWIVSESESNCERHTAPFESLSGFGPVFSEFYLTMYLTQGWVTLHSPGRPGLA